MSLQTILVLLVLLATSRLAMADFDSTWAAYERGDYETAFVELKELAEQGDANAQLVLGGMYANGLGVPGDDREAVKWVRLSADQGNAEGQENLGYMYANGLGVPEDDREALKWFRRAADQGNANSQYKLGILYREGLGVPEDYVQAYAWFNLAAARGHGGWSGEAGRREKSELAKKMTPSQILEAQQLSTKLYEKIPRQ